MQILRNLSIQVAILLALILSVGLVWKDANVRAAQGVWYSSLYPADWTPCYQDDQGRFIQDFSFAGYHAGEKPLPLELREPIVDVTQAPYFADPTGVSDSTAAIQAAIDDVGSQGGGTVYLPEGTYALSVQPGTRYALSIRHNNVVLAGAGSDKTFLRLDSYRMRQSSMIAVSGDGSWTSPQPQSTQYIAADLTYPTQIIPLSGPPVYEVGDWVVLTHDTTADWMQDHNMQDLWSPGAIPGATFYRRVIAVDHEAQTITIDAPIRYYLLRRDRARVYKVGPHVEEVGLMGFSLGMVEHPGTGWGGTDYNVSGTAAYDVHDSTAIRFTHAVNSWVYDVRTYMPEGNRSSHIQSNGILISRSRFITVSHADFRNPQYLGEGGNGYLYTIVGNDSLITHSAAYHGRHNYDFKQGYANGNVITSSFSMSPNGLRSDFHMHLSPSNLIDNMTLDQDRFDAGWRGTSGTTPHGLTTTQTVLWNTNGIRYRPGLSAIVYSEQYGWGYVIGTQGPANQVLIGGNERTLPRDFVEGIGEAATLEPQSLYADQLARRLAREGIIHCPELDFRPRHVRVQVESPRQGQTVLGLLPVTLTVELPDAASSVRRVEVLVDGRTVYSGTSVPEDLTLDTLTLADGRHELVARVTTDRGTSADRTVTFAVNNKWQVSDELQPPLDAGFFGLLDRLRTSDRSDGWEHRTDAPEEFFGDADRLVRRHDTPEYLIWDTPNLRSYSVVVYARTRTVDDQLSLSVAAADGDWIDLDFTTNVSGPSSTGFYRLELTGEPPADVPVARFRLFVNEGNLQVEDLQLGSVELQGFREGAI